MSMLPPKSAELPNSHSSVWNSARASTLASPHMPVAALIW
jgi:hypothetical protein